MVPCVLESIAHAGNAVDNHGISRIGFPMLPEQIAQIKRRIVELGIEHRDLDEVIARLIADPSPDELQLRRLKKHKLWLKDEIARLQMQITPDIPA